GAEETILRQLEALGLEWDGPMVRQSARIDLYRDALRRLAESTYPCACTRSEIEDSALALDGARIYPGTCRRGVPAGRQARAAPPRRGGHPLPRSPPGRDPPVRGKGGRRLRATARRRRDVLPAGGGGRRRRAGRDRRRARCRSARFHRAPDPAAAAPRRADAGL